MAHRFRAASVITVAAVAGLGLPAPAGAGAPAHHEQVEVVAQGLDDPFGLSNRNGKFCVAESSTGEISGIIPGGRGPVVRVAGFPAPAGVDRTREGLLVATGEGEDPGASTSYLSRPGGGPRALTGLAAHEPVENPGGPRQFGDDGEVYVSELLEGVPAGEPGPDFDPSSVGRVVRVATDGSRSVAQVRCRGGRLVGPPAPRLTAAGCRTPRRAPGCAGRGPGAAGRNRRGPRRRSTRTPPRRPAPRWRRWRWGSSPR